MGYYEISQMSNDQDLVARVRACAIQERPDVSVAQWTSNNMLRLCATPGWDEAWTAAVDAEVESPGRSDDVISDAMIKTAVQQLIVAEA